MFICSTPAHSADDAEPTDPGGAARATGWTGGVTIWLHGEVRTHTHVNMHGHLYVFLTLLMDLTRPILKRHPPPHRYNLEVTDHNLSNEKRFDL